MTIKFALKAGCAALAFAGMASANAGLFYLDVGHNYDPAGVDKFDANSTSVKDHLSIGYQSQTTFTDVDNSGGFSVGDTTSTLAGLGISGATTANNLIKGFVPDAVGFPVPASSNNGYGGSNWLISFGITGLTGAITGFGLADGTPAPEITYNSGGVLSLYLWDASSATSKLNFMNIDITGGSSGVGGTFIQGKVDFTGIEGNSFANLFHSATKSCGVSGFYDLWSTCGNAPGDLKIDFSSIFDSDPKLAGAAPVGVDADGHLLIQYGPVRHDASATFDIPEPGSLALLGLALAGLGMTQRRRKQS